MARACHSLRRTSIFGVLFQRCTLLFFISGLVSLASAFYIPGIAPVDYMEGATLDIFANKLTSSINHVPYDYYSMPFCKPAGLEEKKKIKSKRVNLGQLLTGERMKPTKYEINMQVQESCLLLCRKELNPKMTTLIMKRIQDQYKVRLNMDNMPGVFKTQAPNGDVIYTPGYPLGQKVNDKFILNNHLHMKILTHKVVNKDLLPLESSDSEVPLYRVVGFEVYPRSHKSYQQESQKAGVIAGCPTRDSNEDPLVLNNSKDMVIYYTYSVQFEDSPIRWATRWDPLLKASSSIRKVQWMSIGSSIMISVFLTGLVAFILMRTVYLDFVKYNQLETEEDLEEVTGWKLVHADVFRAPPQLGILSVLYGTGIQLLLIGVITIGFAIFGFLSPANRGGLLTMLLLAWVITSFFCGYFSARFYTGLDGKQKKVVTLGASFFYSGLVFFIFFVLNMFLRVMKSQGALPFLTLLTIMGMWFGLSVPLTVFGSFFGYQAKPYSFPTHTNQIPREIPSRFRRILDVITLLGGLLPFAILFFELAFIWNSLWKGAIFYMFGFLGAVFLLLLLSCAELSIIVTYLSLTNEDYRWWWRSFGVSASVGLYVFLYCAYYFLSSAKPMSRTYFVSTMLYAGYSFMLSLSMAILCGAFGLMTTFYFVEKIYSSIRVD